MRLSALAVPVVLLFTSAVFAQHSSSGGSSSSGSSASSHSSSFSSSSGSSAGHNSVSSAGRSGISSSSRSPSVVSSLGTLSSSPARTIAPPEKRTFVSHIFHPFRKAQPHPSQADLRRPICYKGHCSCPGGGSAKNGICSSPQPYHCGSAGYWNGGACLGVTNFRLNDCQSLALLIDQQARRESAAQALRQNSCSAGAPDCGELIARSADESARYQTLKEQYEECRRRSLTSGGYSFSFAGYGGPGLRDPFSPN